MKIIAKINSKKAQKNTSKSAIEKQPKKATQVTPYLAASKKISCCNREGVFRHPSPLKKNKKNSLKKYKNFLENSYNLARQQNLEPVFASINFSIEKIEQLAIQAKKENSTIASLLHKQIAQKLRGTLGRPVDFFFTFGLHSSKKQSSDKATKNALFHIHAIFLLSETERDGRSRASQSMRSTLRDMSYSTNKSKMKQSVFIQTKRKADYWKTYYGTTEKQIAALASYLLDNENQLKKNRWYEKQVIEKKQTIDLNDFCRTHAATKSLAGNFQTQQAKRRATAIYNAKKAKHEQTSHEIAKRATIAQNEANLNACFESLSVLSANQDIYTPDKAASIAQKLMPELTDDRTAKFTQRNFEITRSNQLQDAFSYTEQQAESIAAKEWKLLSRKIPATQNLPKWGSW